MLPSNIHDPVVYSNNNSNNNNQNKPSNDNGMKCNKCTELISPNDWKTNNVSVTNHGSIISHILCPPKPLYIKSIVASISQYTLNSTGSCTINALEAALQLQSGKQASIQLIGNILSLSSLYKNNKHTSVSDIYPHITRYNNNLNKIYYKQITVKQNDILFIINKMMELMIINNNNLCSISAILTKPPETIFLHFNTKYELILFDSHPRSKNGLNGSHFLIFNNKFNLKTYLNELWPYQNLKKLGKGFNNLYAQQINLCDVTLFKLKNYNSNSLISNINIDTFKYEINQISNKLDKIYLNKNQNNNSYNNKHKNDNNNESYEDFVRKFNNNNNNNSAHSSVNNQNINDRKQYLDKIKFLENELAKYQKNDNLLTKTKLSSFEFEITKLKNDNQSLSTQLKSAQMRIKQLEEENRILKLTNYK